jgi:hypothetical protein
MEENANEIVTFVVPSLNRPSLPRSLGSIVAQTDPRWKAIVCFDRRPGARIQDDDDSLTEDYVSRLAEEGEGADAIVFRMIYANGNFLPKEFMTPHKFSLGHFGVSSAVRRSVFDKIQYTRGRGEDYRLIRDIKEAGMCVKFSKYATYLIRQHELTERISDIKRHLEANLSTTSSCEKNIL